MNARAPFPPHQAPAWTYQPGWPQDIPQAVVYRRVELMASKGEMGLQLARRDGSNVVSLQVSVYGPHGFTHNASYLSPQRALALRDALNDYLADLNQEALR